MEVEINKRNNVVLPDDVLYFLANNYLSEKDSLALALSGSISKRFAAVHGENKRCSISRCFYLSVSRWTSYFRQYINPPSISVFITNSCYWIPPEVLISNIVLMKQLEELNVLDTQVSLFHLPRVFSKCRKITRLGLSLAGVMTLQNFQKKKASLKCLKEGFKRLTHLSLFNFEVNRYDVNNPRHCLTAWPVTLGVLSWCHDCIDLRIDVSYRNLADVLDENKICDSDVEIEQWVICVQNFPLRLQWMSSLESLIITRRVWHGLGSDFFVESLVNWMFRRKTNSLRRLWVDGNSPYSSVEKWSSPSVTSFCVGEGASLDYPNAKDQRFRHVQHAVLNMADLRMNNYLLRELSDLKYVRAICEVPEDITTLFEFCEAHPLLESLHFKSFSYEQNLPLLQSVNWKLLKLKSLVYQCTYYPVEEIVNRLIEACPNIESFQLGFKEYGIEGILFSVDYLSAIRFQNLRSLSLIRIQLLDGSFLPSVLKQCPKLERLHLTGGCVPDTFLLNVGQCLPLATKLRDFRLEWRNKAKLPSILLLLKNLLNCSDHLERLVLYNGHHENDWKASSRIGDLLVGFATEMDHLVALCLVGFNIRPKVIRKVYRRVEKEILPQRPAFWFYLDKERPGVNDLRIPRVHYDEVVNPINGFYAPPLTF